MVSPVPYSTLDQGIGCQHVSRILLAQRAFPAADTECVGPRLGSHAAPRRARPAEKVGNVSTALIWLFYRFFNRLSSIFKRFVSYSFSWPIVCTDSRNMSFPSNTFSFVDVRRWFALRATKKRRKENNISILYALDIKRPSKFPRLKFFKHLWIFEAMHAKKVVQRLSQFQK